MKWNESKLVKGKISVYILILNSQVDLYVSKTFLKKAQEDVEQVALQRRVIYKHVYAWFTVHGDREESRSVIEIKLQYIVISMCDVPVNVLKCHVSGKSSHIDFQEFPERNIKQIPTVL